MENMTLVEFREHVGPEGWIRLSWNREDGWVLVVTSGDSKALVDKTQKDDLDALFERCAERLKKDRR
jgi:hypothetical protein